MKQTMRKAAIPIAMAIIRTREFDDEESESLVPENYKNIFLIKSQLLHVFFTVNETVVEVSTFAAPIKSQPPSLYSRTLCLIVKDWEVFDELTLRPLV